jgi:hypothetical protein
MQKIHEDDHLLVEMNSSGSLIVTSKEGAFGRKALISCSGEGITVLAQRGKLTTDSYQTDRIFIQ